MYQGLQEWDTCGHTRRFADVKVGGNLLLTLDVPTALKQARSISMYLKMAQDGLRQAEEVSSDASLDRSLFFSRRQASTP
jgi:hypothetical protein